MGPRSHGHRWPRFSPACTPFSWLLDLQVCEPTSSKQRSWTRVSPAPDRTPDPPVGSCALCTLPNGVTSHFLTQKDSQAHARLRVETGNA